MNFFSNENMFYQTGTKKMPTKKLWLIQLKLIRKKWSFCLKSPCDFFPEEISLQIGPGIDE